MTLVVDASVIVKWLLNDPARETDTALATDIMQRAVDGREAIIQPVHWLLDVGAVLTRLNPARLVKAATAGEDVVIAGNGTPLVRLVPITNPRGLLGGGSCASIKRASMPRFRATLSTKWNVC